MFWTSERASEWWTRIVSLKGTSHWNEESHLRACWMLLLKWASALQFGTNPGLVLDACVDWNNLMVTGRFIYWNWRSHFYIIHSFLIFIGVVFLVFCFVFFYDCWLWLELSEIFIKQLLGKHSHLLVITLEGGWSRNC